MDWIVQFVLIMLIKIVSPASISSTSVIPLKNEELKTSSTYQVTENIKDIPDNRTLPPIIPNFGLVRPLNFGNNTVAINNIVKQNNTDISATNNGGTSEESAKSSEENNNTESSEEDNNGGKVKKNSFSILHIKAEYDEKPVQHQNVLSKVFGGIKNYVYSLKKGVVDGLHNFFHQHDDKKKTEFHDKFHRNFNGDVDDYADYYDDESIENFDNY